MNDTPDAITGGALIAGGVLIGLLFRWLVGEAYRQMRRIRRGPQVTAQVSRDLKRRSRCVISGVLTFTV